ncbi:uncharacterized protein LOC123441337 [Hordeum vulgare subsp. vulgare]|uniref:uncharacterized protein LOC123441334 n=1 Tax=Hordeum vulgare subsp. vulgare TaxID=112509 RepID=UPI001D1A41ED|nr:uncharacterized protein LOC123441334 [Hordeum vulgare subsp. vulgare]XP_044973752.1 uncharacterized protein LOC123441337 [Hordeum vulgare subsp. vulgare]
MVNYEDHFRMAASQPNKATTEWVEDKDAIGEDQGLWERAAKKLREEDTTKVARNKEDEREAKMKEELKITLDHYGYEKQMKEEHKKMMEKCFVSGAHVIHDGAPALPRPLPLPLRRLPSRVQLQPPRRQRHRRHEATVQQEHVQAGREEAGKQDRQGGGEGGQGEGGDQEGGHGRGEEAGARPGADAGSAGAARAEGSRGSRGVDGGEAAGRGAAGGRVRGREGGRLHQQVPTTAAATEAQLAAQLQGDAQPRRIADADQHRIQRFD